MENKTYRILVGKTHMVLFCGHERLYSYKWLTKVSEHLGIRESQHVAIEAVYIWAFWSCSEVKEGSLFVYDPKDRLDPEVAEQYLG